MISNMRRDKVALLAEVLRVSPLDIIHLYAEQSRAYNEHEDARYEHDMLIKAYDNSPEMIKDAVWHILQAERPKGHG